MILWESPAAQACRDVVAMETVLGYAAFLVATRRSPRMLTKDATGICIRPVGPVPEGEVLLRVVEPLWMRA